MSDDALILPATSEPCAMVRSCGFSERALDATTFFLADVADGLGPFLIIDLTSRRGWSASDAGLAMACLLVGTVLSQTFTGAWVDVTRWKRLAISAGAAIVAMTSIGLYYATSRTGVFALQGITGVAVTIFPPAIGAVSLGLVGRRRLPERAGRNEACFHAGNVFSAGLAAGLNQVCGSIGIFYGVACMAVASSLSALMIREKEIDHELARGADDGEGGDRVLPIRELLKDQRIVWFAIAVVLFHMANAAMLPLVGQKVGHRMPSFAPTLMAMCIIMAQITMVPVALLASRAAVFSRRNVFLVGFAVLPIRGMLYTLTDQTGWLIANQILDGVGAGIFGVVALLMMADLTQGTGRFNFAQGIVATGIGLGAAVSNYLTGLLVDRFGFNTGFLVLSGIAVGALVVFAWKVPETRDVE